MLLNNQRAFSIPYYSTILPGCLIRADIFVFESEQLTAQVLQGPAGQAAAWAWPAASQPWL